MILTYSRESFVYAIKQGRKIHTIRADPKKRWKVGMKIQHWKGSPRNPRQIPFKFADGECKGIQELTIARTDYNSPLVHISERGFLTWDETVLLAKNDGLTIEEFTEWFVPIERPFFEGRIIHFTDLKY